MRLIEQKRKNSIYLYFLAKGQRKYLGKPDKINQEKAKEALNLLDTQITEYKSFRDKIEKYLHGKREIEFKDPEYKMIFFDMDGVLFEKPWQESKSRKVAISTWDLLFKKLGQYNIHEALKKNFENGLYGDDVDSYIKWKEAACKTLKIIPLDEKTFQEVIDSRILSRGAKELFQILKKSKIKTAIITGSFYRLAQRAKNELDEVNHVRAQCRLFFGDNSLLKGWELNKTDYKHKIEIMEELALKEGIIDKNGRPNLNQCVYVGDDVNDLEAFEAAGLAIAFNSQKNIVKKAADIIIVGGDLTEILSPLFNFEMDKEKISFYVSKDVKDEWLNFAKTKDHSTLPDFIMKSVEFYIKEERASLKTSNKIPLFEEE
ncbi:MAG: HAD family hydrolase [Promethearchaeota archaeon]|jgi:phosphoserine phosphatase